MYANSFANKYQATSAYLGKCDALSGQFVNIVYPFQGTLRLFSIRII